MYPIAQIIELATGKPPTAAQLDGWTAYENTGGSLQSIVEAFVASTMFANKYNNGTSINPDAPISATVAQEIIENALGAMPATAHVSSWVATGLSVAQVFQDFALGDQYTAAVASQFFIYEGSGGGYFIVPLDPVAAVTLAAPMQIIGVGEITNGVAG